MGSRLTAVVFLLLLTLRLATAAPPPLVQMYIAWDHDAPGDVRTYNLYISDTQDTFGTVPYARITRLPTDNSPFLIRLPVGTKYMVVRAWNEYGESESSNQLQVDTTFAVTDLGS